MIKFFRKIRYNLMSENKTSKYFKYAIGEIILVVIGILIALQINNTNEQRKETKELKEYLHKISTNVQSDIDQIEKLKIRRDTVRAKAIRSSKALRANDFSKIEDIFLGRSCFVEFYFIPDKSGFEALKSSSYLGKINNTKVDSLLSLYYSRVDKTHADELSYNTFIENMEVKLSERIDLTSLYILYGKIYINNEAIDINEYTDILPYIQDNAFKSAIFRTLSERTYLGNYPKLIELGNALIQEINMFCNNDY